MGHNEAALVQDVARIGLHKVAPKHAKVGGRGGAQREVSDLPLGLDLAGLTVRSGKSFPR